MSIVWTDDNTAALLQAAVEFRQSTGSPVSFLNVNNFMDTARGLLPPQVTPRQVYSKVRRLRRKASRSNKTQCKRLKLASMAFAPAETKVTSHGSDPEEDEENNELEKIDVVQPGSDHEEDAEENNELKKIDVVQPAGSDHVEDDEENYELKKIDVVQPAGSDHVEDDEENYELQKIDVVQPGSDHEDDDEGNHEPKKIDEVRPAGSDHREEADEENNELEKIDAMQPYPYPFLKMAFEGLEKLLFEEVLKQGLVGKHILDQMEKKWKDFSVKKLQLRWESCQLYEQNLNMLIAAIQKKYADQ